MQESQLRIYNDIKKKLNQNLCDNKTRTLIILAYVILSDYKSSIDFYVKMAISYGATKRDFLNVISCIMGDMKLLNSIMELYKIIDDTFQEPGFVENLSATTADGIGVKEQEDR